jgi:cation:H+ antiporter
VAPFITLAGWTLVGLVLLVAGAEALVRGGSSIGLRFGLTPLFIGLTIVACGTSAPELVVSLSAALQGKGDISIANVVGSNIFNIAVILGITALLMPIRIQLPILKVDIPVMIAVSLLGIICISWGPLTVLHGSILVALLIAYISFTYYMARREQQKSDETGIADIHPHPSRALLLDLVFIGSGIALMVKGSDLLVDSAVRIASLFGVSEAVIGLTLVATGTSLPELATSIVAAYRKFPEVAVGNVVGSNIFNILGIMGVTSLVTPLSAPGIGSIDLAAMFVAAVLLLPLAWTGKILSRWEGLALLAGYGGYLWWLWPSH